MSNDETNNKLSTINKVTIGGQKVGLAKRIAEKQSIAANADYSNFPNRLGIVFDDSSSMRGTKIDKAHEAIDIFIKNCNSGDTAIALYPLNAECKNLSNIFASIGIYAATIQATGGTPLYSKLRAMIESEAITRAIAFSDGSPTDDYGNWSENDGVENNHIKTMKLYKDKKIPIDTIYIGELSSEGYKKMLQIAEETGGIFLHFTDPSVLAKNLKYLTPHYRAMLMDKNTREAVEKGSL